MYLDIVTNIRAKYKSSLIGRLVINYILIITFCFAISLFLSNLLWAKYISLIHTLFEFGCIYIALSTFIINWHTKRFNSSVNDIIGFGFLSVAIFDGFHTYYFQSLKLYPQNIFDLSIRYWIVGRLVEALVLLLATSGILKKSIPRWAGLFLTLFFSFGTSFCLLHFPKLIPVLFTHQGITLVKRVLEYIVIGLFIVGLVRLRGKVYDESKIAFKNIFMAILLAIPAELCFTVYKDINSFYAAFGHVLKLAYYYFLFRGIFESAIVYPYEKLKESDRYKTDLLNKFPIAINNYDSNYRLILLNQRTSELIGYTFEELKGKSADQITQLLHRQENGKTIETLARKVNNPSNPITHKLRTITDKYGKQKNIKVDVHKLDNGEFIYLYNDANKDQELEHLQLQTRTILDSLGNLVILYDREFNVITCNRAFERFTGLGSKQITGMKMLELHRKLKFTTKPLLKNLKNEKSLDNPQYEANLVSMDGVKKDLILQASPVRNLDGEIIGSIEISADISDLKKDQQTRFQQEKLAMLGQMGAAILHETKNFLATIKGSSQLLNLIAKDEKVKAYAKKIDNATNEVDNIVNNFLSLGKPKEQVLCEFSVNEMINEIKDVLKSSALINGITFEKHLHSHGMVLCDKDQMKHVVLNLCKNAIEAMSETNAPKLLIETGDDINIDATFIKITDNGKGISPEEMTKIGKPFFTTKEYGTGLGLNICFKIIEEHGGKLDIKSELGQGSIFKILLPNSKAHNLKSII